VLIVIRKDSHVRLCVLFSSQVDSIRELIERIQENVDKVKKKHSDLLSDPLANESE
jgi:t-SNARE complex subunit (syntaxin)